MISSSSLSSSSLAVAKKAVVVVPMTSSTTTVAAAKTASRMMQSFEVTPSPAMKKKGKKNLMTINNSSSSSSVRCQDTPAAPSTVGIATTAAAMPPRVTTPANHPPRAMPEVGVPPAVLLTNNSSSGTTVPKNKGSLKSQLKLQILQLQRQKQQQQQQSMQQQQQSKGQQKRSVQLVEKKEQTTINNKRRTNNNEEDDNKEVVMSCIQSMIHTLEEENAKTMMMIPSFIIQSQQQQQPQQYQVFPYTYYPSNNDEMIMAMIQQQQQHQQGGPHAPYYHLGEGQQQYTTPYCFTRYNIPNPQQQQHVNSNDVMPNKQPSSSLSTPVPSLLSSAKVSIPPSTAAATGKLLHPNPLTDPNSPYIHTHELLFNNTMCITKKNDGNDKFGITLHYEYRSALVPRDVVMAINEDKNKTIPSRQPRRKRMNYGVVSIVDASKATYLNTTTATTTSVASILEPGDIVLTINGQSVGGMTFSNAVSLMSLSESAIAGLNATTTSTTGDDILCCYLTVARRRRRRRRRSMNVNHGMQKSTTPTVQLLPSPSRIVVGGVPTNNNPTTMIQIPFVVNGNGTISGQFSNIEWKTLIHGVSTLSHRLFSGMALLTISQRDALLDILRTNRHLHCRDLKSLETKLEYESNCLLLEMKQFAKKYWTMKWKVETATNNDDNDSSSTTVRNETVSMLTDAQRSVLRGSVRPATGECKCGSSSHTFVSDSRCPLYRDVRQYCKDNSIDIRGSSTTSQQYNRGNVKVNTNNVLEKAYVDRYIKLRNEDSAIRDEAIFVLEMETIQSSMMNKAVLAPTSLCTLLLSAVASIQDQDELYDSGVSATSNKVDMMMNRTSSKMEILAAAPDSDDEDVPLNALVQQQRDSKQKVSTATNSSSPSKRPKRGTEYYNKTRSINNLPHSYFMAKILKHISRCHGHVFTEPSHADYSWQQRHRSVITTPLSKEVMFKGNPRTPGYYHLRIFTLFLMKRGCCDYILTGKITHTRNKTMMMIILIL